MIDELQPIPWRYTDSGGVLQWAWVTDHFIARIVGHEASGEVDVDRRVMRNYRWELADLIQRNQDLPRVIVEGASRTWEEAEERIKENVGKAYDPRLGYRAFCGSSTFTFDLASGERIDVSSFLGTICNVTVLVPGGGERVVSGEFDVRNYRWIVSSRDGSFEVVPEHVVRITNRSETADRAAEIAYSPTYSGIGRIYREEYRAGCTGKPGFEAGTVDHAGAERCPIHERGISEHLLK